MLTKNANILHFFLTFLIVCYYIYLFIYLSLLLDIVSIIPKITKCEQEYHISNQLFLI